MTRTDRALQELCKEVDRLRLVAAVAAKLRGQAHRLEAHGMGDAAAMIRRHLDDLDKTVARINNKLTAYLSVVDPSLEETQPFGRAR